MVLVWILDQDQDPKSSPANSVCEVMNMIGAVKHVGKALEAGVDLICTQGGEGGGHTGERFFARWVELGKL